MWPLLENLVEASLVVSLDDAARAMKLVADRVHVIMEGAAACAVAAALSPSLPPAATGRSSLSSPAATSTSRVSRTDRLLPETRQPRTPPDP